MSDPANHPENGNGAADASGPSLGRAEVLPHRGPRRFGPSHGLRLWARRTFSRKQLLTSLKTMLWVVPLTILIWIYAEREQEYSPPPVTIPIQIYSNDPNVQVTLRRPEDSLVMANIKGPRSGVEAVIHSWDPNSPGGPVRIEIPRNLGTTGERRLDAAGVIGNDQRFATHGVSVSSCRPDGLEVWIDPIEDRQVDVKAVNVPTNVSSVVFSPPTVKVRAPDQVLADAAKSGALYASADLSHRPELAAPDPSTHTVTLSDVTVTLPFMGRDVAIVGSPVVQAEVTLKSNKEIILSTVTVEIAATPQIIDNYAFKLDPPTLPDVHVVGPEDKIALLDESNPDSKKYRKAVFEVTSEDISAVGPGGSKKVDVEFKFPPGVQVVQPKEGPYQVKFTLSDRRSSQ